jgi:hypothetical protein
MKKVRWGLLVIALDVVALVALVFVYPHLMIGAGPLLAGHEALADDCFACHAPLRGAATARCVACHETAAIGLRTTKGQPLPASTRMKVSFHQDLLQGDCMACHSDHRGAHPLPSQQRFSHALLQPAVRTQCDSCHRRPDDRLHRAVDGDCAQCHGTQAWKPATFDHDRHFVLDRDHKVDCITCHRSSTGATGSVGKAGASAIADFSQYTCYGCHEHTPAKIRAEHEEEGIRDFRDCVRCHRSAQEEPRERGREGGREGGRREKD